LSLDKQFLGTGWAFPPAFDWRTREAITVSQEQDVEESLRILLSTVPGERVMQPTYGCGLQRMVFEVVNESTLTELRSIVEKAVLFFEVRITLEQLDIDNSQLHDGVLRLRLDYTIRSSNTRHNMVYPLYLNEGAQQGVPA
jgi:phage baseplate assembly protein W